MFLLLATLAVGTSRSLCRLNQRSWAVTIFVGLSTTVWIVQGLYLFEYYLVSGALLTIVLACYAVPAWRGLPVSQAAALLSGASATLAVFTSHAWLPTAVALFMSNILQPDQGTNKRSSALAFAGATVLTTAACLAWLWNYGSIRGYIVFHVIFAHTVYLQTIRPVNPELTLAKFGVSLMPSFSPERLVQSLSNVLLILSVIMGLRLYRPVALAFGVLGILAANARGNVGFQDGTFLILSIALFALTTAQAVESITKTWRGSVFATVFCVVLVAGAEAVMRHALSSPNSLTRQVVVQDRPVRIAALSNAAEFAFIRSIVRPNERLLSLIYRPYDYWLAGRLPIKGFYEYLPQDALYASHPLLGVRRDLCKAMQQDPPPAVIFDNWKVWDYYAPRDYMPCILDILHAEYTPSPLYPTLFIRHDRTSAR